MENHVDKLNRYRRERSRKRKRGLLVAALSLIVVVSTVLVLMLPAVTLETVCGLEAHRHGAGCYSSAEVPGTTEIVCGFETGGIAVLHTHDEYCYDADGVLICKLPELTEHRHTDGCFAEGELICGKEEIALHTHTKECADGSCGLRKTVAHQHTGDCIRKTENHVEQTLTCRIPEHIHTAECYPDKGTVCGIKAHTHGESCFNGNGDLVCLKREHEHTEECTAGKDPGRSSVAEASSRSSKLNGKTYSFSFPEEEKIMLSGLIDALDVIYDAYSMENEAFDSVDMFLREVTNAECPDGSPVKVTRTEDDWELERPAPFDGEAAVTVTMKNGDVFTVLMTDTPERTYRLSDSGEFFKVTVTYKDDARIPEGSTLKVTVFDEGMDAYEYARKTVLADRLAKGESVDFSDLSVLDISIFDPLGNETEPEAPVWVDMTIKSLPGVEDLNDVASTLTINHHVETADGVVVETVYDGGAEAGFLMENREAATADGLIVDPNTADLSKFGFSSFDLYGDGSIAAGDPQNADDALDVSFPTPVFSTFTVTWGGDASNTTANYRWRSGSQNSATTYGQVTFHYVDRNGNPITRPSGIGNNTNDTNHTGNSVNYDVNIEDTFGLNISGYSYQGAYYNSATGEAVTSVRLYRNYGTRYIQLNNGDTQVYQLTANGSGTPTAHVYLVYSGSSGNTATVHYVDEDGNELTVSNGQPVNDTADNLNYLIYDVDGYEYAYTYRNSDTDANRITPVLQYSSGNGWRYTKSTASSGTRTWTNLESGDDVYVVYKKKDAVPQGGTPIPKITGEKPAAPTITKESADNGDGTKTLSLSVSGHTSVMEAEKLADVIVVFDVSGSMRYRIDSETNASVGQRRMDYAQTAAKSLANALLGRNTSAHPELIRMALISFSNTAGLRQDFTTDLTVFNNAVTNLPSPDGGTNWENALQMANEMAVESDRATFVIFVTDGNPTFRQTRGVLNNSGTGALGDNDVSGYYFTYNVYGRGNSDEHDRNYGAALTHAQSIVDHNKIFYTIGISSDVTKLTEFTTDAGAGADHSKSATSNDELISAFNDIAASVIALMGHSDIQITDGITDLTQTVKKSDLVTYEDDDFTYYKGHPATAQDVTNGLAAAVGDMVWVSWTPSSEGCAEAVYNTSTGAVEWNMGTGFMPQDGYTYQVRFRVWPSQAAYDLLADLNNGKKSYESLTDEEKAQITEPDTPGGMYTLKTNSETGYTYREATKSGNSVTPTGEPSSSVGFSDVDPLELTTKPLKVQKQWYNNYVDSRTVVDKITMELYGVDSDGVTSHDFKTITLTKDGGWYAENNYISYGLVTYDTGTNSNVKIYEPGHDFTLRETDDEAHYYELTAGVFRAMVINGTPTILEKTDTAPAGMGAGVFHYSDASGHYYRLDSQVYRDTESDVLLIATNSHRSYMDFAKTVVDDLGNAAVDGTEFEYNIRFTVPAGIANYDSLEKYIWFSVYDSVAKRTLSPDEYTYTNVQKPAEIDGAYSGSAYADYLVATSGVDFTLKIKQGWNVRFLNLPNNTAYSFEEVNVPAGYDFVKAEVSGTRWISNMVGGTDHGSAQTMSPLPSNTSADNDDTRVSGTIDFANARYKTTYTNKTVTAKVKILKTAQDGATLLSDAVFSLYSENGYTSDPKQTVGVGLTSDEHGVIDLGKLSLGKYYLVETAAPPGYIKLSDPVVITVGDTEVTYAQNGNNLSLSGHGVSYDPATQVYTLTVTNSTGYELPSTGGPGVTFLYALGGMLALGAGALLLWRRRKKK